MGSIKVDERLTAQLESAAADDDIQAVFTLKAENPNEPVPSPERTEEMANVLLKRVAEQAGVDPDKVNIFKYMGSFVVSAKPNFIKAVLKEPEVASAMANKK